jgi:threonine aldolase
MNQTRPITNMTSDGLALSPKQYSELLLRLSADGQLRADAYGDGGSVQALELEMAKLLGKEAAVVMPTGTMANLLAVEYLAGRASKVIVQAKSHLFNDCGDCAAMLAGLQLLPLGEGASFDIGNVQAEIDRASEGKVRAPIGVLSIETPVRRLNGEMFDFETMRSVVRVARDNNIKLHLDGARLPVVEAYTGHGYVSLYKCFNSLNGGILAGDGELIDRVFHWRRRNGGGMAQLWPIAAVAHHFLPGVVGRLEDARGISEEFFGLLQADTRFEHSVFTNGSTVSRVALVDADPSMHEVFRAELMSRSVHLPAVDGNAPGFTIKVNESWRYTTPDGLYSAFSQAAGATGRSN